VLSAISGDKMPRKSKPVAILGVGSLSVSERVLLFCVASDTDSIKAGVSSATEVMIVKNLLEGDQGGHLAITDFGRRVLDFFDQGEPGKLMAYQRRLKERDGILDRVCSAMTRRSRGYLSGRHRPPLQGPTQENSRAVTRGRPGALGC
jgi:hypothetical protein